MRTVGVSVGLVRLFFFGNRNWRSLLDTAILPLLILLAVDLLRAILETADSAQDYVSRDDDIMHRSDHFDKMKRIQRTVTDLIMLLFAGGLATACGTLDSAPVEPPAPFVRRTPRVGRYAYSSAIMSGTLLITQATPDTIRYSWDVHGKQDTTTRFDDLEQNGPYSEHVIINSYLLVTQVLRSEMPYFVTHIIRRDGDEMKCRWFEIEKTILSLAECSLVYLGP